MKWLLLCCVLLAPSLAVGASSGLPLFVRATTDGKVEVFPTADFADYVPEDEANYAIADRLLPVTRLVPLRQGLAVGVAVEGHERWLHLPYNGADVQFCDSVLCLEVVEQGYEAINDVNRLATILSCLGMEVNERDALPARLEDYENPPPARSEKEIARLGSLLAADDKEQGIGPALQIPVEFGPGGCVVDKRASQQQPDFRAYRTTKERQAAFMNYMLPYALELQEKTGLPASVVLAQAGHESGWGTSNVFRSSGNFLGHSCFKRGAVKKYTLPTRGAASHTVEATCSHKRPSREGGYYLKFGSPQDCFYAYGANLLGRSRHYAGVRAAVDKADPAVAEWREVVKGLGAYATDPSYQRQIAAHIRNHGLAPLEDKKLCR